MFTGRQWDSESGLYYYRARYYSPSLGRFLQPDPIAQFVQLYSIEHKIHGPLGKTAMRKFLTRTPIGRFLAQRYSSLLESDGILTDFNLYAYSGNNPVNFVDPQGLWTWGGVWDDIKDFFEGAWETIKGGTGMGVAEVPVAAAEVAAAALAYAGAVSI
jgi:uncharacterized protein RhaS with RHS repeats